MNNKTFTFFSILFFCFFSSFSTSAQGVVDVRFGDGNLDCTANEYCTKIQITAATAENFFIGTSSILFNYNEAAVSYFSYTPERYNGDDLCVVGAAPAWDEQQWDAVSVTGIINITLTLNSTAFSCPEVTNAEWINVGEICFGINDGSLSPDLIFNQNDTNFNRNEPNNGSQAIPKGTFTDVTGTDVLSCNSCTAPATPTISADANPICMSGTGSPVNAVFSTTDTPPAGFSYQWQLNGTNISAASGGTGTTLTTSTLGDFSLIFTDGAGCESVASNSITLTSQDCTPICTAPAAPTISADANPICMSGTGSPVNAVFSTTDTPPAGFTYQWQLNGSNISAASGGTGTTLTTSTLGDFSLIFTDGAGCESIASNSVTLTSEDCTPLPTPQISITDPCNCTLGVDNNNDNINELASETITITSGTAPYTVTVVTGLVDATGAALTVVDAQALLGAGNSIAAYIPADGVSTFSISIEDANNLTASINGGPCAACPDTTPTCNITSGSITLATSTFCTDDAISFGATTSTFPAGYQVAYVLTSGGIIQDTNTSNSFPAQTTTGSYQIHLLVYDPATLDLSTIVAGTTPATDINDQLIQGGGTICATLTLTGGEVTVQTCSPTCNITPGAIQESTLTYCGGDLIDFGASSSSFPSGYEVIYVLTSGGVIQDTSAISAFTAPTTLGTYGLHLLVYDPDPVSADYLDLNTITFGTTTAADVDATLVQGGGTICAALTMAPLNVEVEACTPTCNITSGNITLATSTFCTDDAISFGANN